MKNKYLTDDEIYNIEVAIYNDDVKALHALTSEVLESDTIDQEVVKELTKGLQYIHIEQDPRYLLTIDGQILSTKTVKRMKPIVSANTLFFYIASNKKIDVRKEFEKQGWEFDYDEVLKNYKRNKYGVQVHPNYRHNFERI